jgi:hypothetical protein
VYKLSGEPAFAAAEVIRGERAVAAAELESAKGGRTIRAFSLCEDFETR